MLIAQPCEYDQLPEGVNYEAYGVTSPHSLDSIDSSLSGLVRLVHLVIFVDVRLV